MAKKYKRGYKELRENLSYCRKLVKDTIRHAIDE